MNRPTKANHSGSRAIHWYRVYLAILLIALFSCTPKGEEENPIVNGSAISFAAGLDADGWDAATKVTEMDKDHISNFSVNATMGGGLFDFMLNTTVVRTVPATDNQWTYSPLKYYPTDGTTIYFYAYTPSGSINVQKITTTVIGNSASITYKVPLNTSVAAERIQEDFLVASNTGTNSTDKIGFNFYHALAHLSFVATNQTGNDVVITAIQLLYLDREGVLPLPLSYGGVAYWNANTDYSSIYQATMPLNGVLVPSTATRSLTSENDGLVILPQSLAFRLPGSGIPSAGGGYPDDAGPGHTTQASYLAATFHNTDAPGTDIVKYISMHGIEFSNKSYVLKFTLKN